MNKKINILLSAAGGSSTIELIKRFQKHEGYNVIAMDSDSYAVGLYICDTSYVVPFVNNPDFKNIVKDIIDKHEIDVYIPLIDEEIDVAYEIATEYSNLEIMAPNREFCSNMLNKWNMYKLFSQNDISVPETFLLKNQKDICFESPKIVKPIIGRGSRGVQILNTIEELKAYCVLSKYSEEELILQEYINGTEYTVSVIVTKSGEILGVVPKRIIRKRGITQIAITEKNDVIEKLCVDIQSKLKANGPFNVQLMILQGKPYVFEINPRFSTSIVLTMESGIDEMDVLIKDISQLPYTVNPFKEGIIMSRYYEQKYLQEYEIKCKD